MTPQERAEKIERMFPPALPDVLRKEFIDKVAAQIKEAEREAILTVKRKPGNCLRCGHADGSHNEIGCCFWTDPTEIETKCVCTWIAETKISTWNAAREKAKGIASYPLSIAAHNDWTRGRREAASEIADRIGKMEPEK